ncbi:anti-sigma-K factor RskA [Sphingomonas sp. BE138]|uniref:hypothetical protein n=1 Tax=Sphingomonas sp. BE138 TaxID=2817845 RepID=UPI0028678303|nr:hypothetical protein [Sphingomonas sp. BE138]MDR6788109.1 anti-sigma-K factor RskA [Sphingomonas sp. BE138]
MSDEQPNEILATAAAAKAHEEAGAPGAAAHQRKGHWNPAKTWLGVGIGSAAVAAAVLFANARKDEGKK